MKGALAHASFGFAMAVALWSLDMLPNVWPDGTGGLQGRHALENSAAVARQLAGE